MKNKGSELLCTVEGTFEIQRLGIILTPDVPLTFFDSEQVFPFTCDVSLHCPDGAEKVATARFVLPHFSPLAAQLAVIKARVCACILLDVEKSAVPPGTEIRIKL